MRIHVAVGSLAVGEKFFFRGNEYEVMRNNDARYVQATALHKLSNLYLEQDEEVEIERCDSNSGA